MLDQLGFARRVETAWRPVPDFPATSLQWLQFERCQLNPQHVAKHGFDMRILRASAHLALNRE